MPPSFGGNGWTGTFLSAKAGISWDTTFRISQSEMRHRCPLLRIWNALGGEYEANHRMGLDPWDVSGLSMRL
jgi:hypothetical protein